MKSLLEFYINDLVKNHGVKEVSDFSRDAKVEILHLMQRSDNEFDIQDAIRNFLIITRKGDHPKEEKVMALLEDLICKRIEETFDDIVDLLQDEIIDFYRSHLQLIIYDFLYDEDPYEDWDPRDLRESITLSYAGL